ncbi:hypothetical protein [uncultured Gilliamella sp.]|uniref:hypothetical protein n=1 Tax=uncultured Gilliamella sp. TaxID=1193505 RepID=UPI0025F9A032|nr:hypothetical protein [uncultured Gilliamella sp.]
MKIIVTRDDMIAVKQCSRGGREFFKRHGLDWNQFLKEGIDAEILRSTNDAMANQVIEHAERRTWAEVRKSKL